MYRSIIISGLPGSGKTVLAQHLSRIYEWSIYSIGGLFRQRWARLPEMSRPSFEDWWKNRGEEEQMRVNVELREMVREGRIIADTRFAQYCSGLDGLSIFITAPLDIRAMRALGNEKYKGKSFRQINEILNCREEDEVMVGYRVIGKDFRQTEDYHCTINSGLLSVVEEIAMVVAAMGGSVA